MVRLQVGTAVMRWFFVLLWSPNQWQPDMGSLGSSGYRKGMCVLESESPSQGESLVKPASRGRGGGGCAGENMWTRWLVAWKEPWIWRVTQLEKLRLNCNQRNNRNSNGDPKKANTVVLDVLVGAFCTSHFIPLWSSDSLSSAVSSFGVWKQSLTSRS